MLKNYVTNFQNTIIEACEIHEKNEQLKQQMQQLQIDFQKKKFKHQNVKQKNKKLIKQVNRLRTKLKNFRNEFFSEFDNEEKNKNDSMKSKKKIIENKHIFKYFEFFTFIDDKKSFYKD